MVMDDYQRGFGDGWMQAMNMMHSGEFEDEDTSFKEAKRRVGIRRSPKRKPKNKRRQSAKQKLLTQLADKKWKSYKRKYPKGKKTYVTIRAEVSRSQLYKKKAKRLG